MILIEIRHVKNLNSYLTFFPASTVSTVQDSKTHQQYVYMQETYYYLAYISTFTN